MRVALLTNMIPPYRLPQLEALQCRVGELHVFLSTRMENDRKRWHWEVDWGKLSVTVQRCVSWNGHYRDPLGFDRQLQIHCPYDTLQQLKRYAPDVVIAVELGVRSAQAALYRRLNRDSSLLIWAGLSEHTERAWGLARRTLRKRILSAADGVMVNGESGARYIRGFRLPDNRIFRVTPAHDIQLFSKRSGPRPARSAIRLLHCGALSPRKGIVRFMRILLAWAARNTNRTIEVCWLGDGPERSQLESMALPLNLSQRFLGHLTYQELPEIYADADAFFFPTLMDEWGLVVNEAMAMGLPVLGSIYSQAVEELVEDGVTGWTVDPRDETSVEAALDRALALSPDALSCIGNAARRRIKPVTPVAVGEQIVHAIRAVLDQRALARPSNAAR
jgi:glycosyltransferase involved in cell wall biosynthesis